MFLRNMSQGLRIESGRGAPYFVADVNTASEGRDGSIDLTVATAARAFTRALSRKRSNASLVARDPGDSFRQYASTADRIEVKWGADDTYSHKKSRSWCAATVYSNFLGKRFWGVIFALRITLIRSRENP